MEQIVYIKTLDLHKNGIQFTLQGFETADKMARRIEISLMASGDTIDLPSEQITAMMYVTTPSATEPSVNACTIKDNKIIYDVLPIVEEGITEMKLKLVETSVDGAKSVLATPTFAAEVSKSNTDDESVEQTTTFTALEDAIAVARGVYEARLIRIELDSDCMFRAYYADGTTYESDVLKELFLKGDALISQSYARGGSGVRAGEDTDNSMYYSIVSKSASEDARMINEESKEVLTEVRKHGVYTAFSVDFESGEVEYISPSYKFNINEETGDLEAEGITYSFEETVENIVNEWLIESGANIDEITNNTDANAKDIADLKVTTNAHSKDIETLKASSATCGEDISILYSSVADNTEDITKLNESVETNTENISSLTTTVGQHSAVLVSQQGQIEGINSNLDAMRNRIGRISVMEKSETSTIVRDTLDYERRMEFINIAGTINLTPIASNGVDETRSFYFEDNNDNSWRIRPFKDMVFPVVVKAAYSDYVSHNNSYIRYDSSTGYWTIDLPADEGVTYEVYINLMFVIGFDSVG